MADCALLHPFPITLALVCAFAADCALGDDASATSPEQPQIMMEVSEELLNRFVATTDTRVEPVRDFVLGADVFGWQQTTTQTSLDLKPAGDWIAGELFLRGTTWSDTVGYTPRATAYSNGWHQFAARKEIIFPGDYLYTRRPRVQVRPHVHNRAIYPMGGGLPLIGPLIVNIAYQQAEARRPQAESIAGRKIAVGVGQNFNREVDEQLATLNQTLQRDRETAPLRERLKPEVVQFQSTETSLSYRGRFDSDRQIAAPPEGTEGAGARLSIHESIVADAISRSGMSGEVFVPDDAFTFLETVLRGAEGRGAPPLPSDLEFVRPTGAFSQVPIRLFGEVPIEARFGQGELEITLRAELQWVPDQWSPPLLMEFAYSIEMFDEYIRATPDARLVKPVEPELGTELLLFQPIIRLQMQEMLPIVHIPRTQELSVGDAGTSGAGGKSVRLRVERLIIADGWLVLSVD